MPLDIAIEKGREHRRPYRGAKAVDRTCCNHGGKGKRHNGNQCLWCLGSRMIRDTREKERIRQEMDCPED